MLLSRQESRLTSKGAWLQPNTAIPHTRPLQISRVLLCSHRKQVLSERVRDKPLQLQLFLHKTNALANVDHLTWTMHASTAIILHVIDESGVLCAEQHHVEVLCKLQHVSALNRNLYTGRCKATCVPVAELTHAVYQDRDHIRLFASSTEFASLLLPEDATIRSSKMCGLSAVPELVCRRLEPRGARPRTGCTTAVESNVS